MIYLDKEENDMFLQIMNIEEKEKFLEFVYKVANVEGEFAEEEQEIINSYKKELGVSEIPETSDIEGLIGYFSTKVDEIKKLVLFEIIGLINADNKIAKEEEKILNKVVASFGLDNEVVERIKSAAKKLQDVYDEVYDVLFG
ncbi:MAG: hypothetical protein SPI28_10085, partial [Acetatifactor sp.]|nr:hypothetical protein [Acetatifactor sp.]